MKSSDEMFEQPPLILKHIGDYDTATEVRDVDKIQREREFLVNMGRAMETLRRELPYAFHMSNLDMSIFSNQITVCNGNVMNKLQMPKTMYTAVVKSLRVASTLSFTQPCVNVRKIEYIEECRTIQCLVDIVLPDTVRIEGGSTWDGMFYFGLDKQGLIETHIFDKKITNQDRNPFVTTQNYPWIKNAVAPWVTGDSYIPGIPLPQYAMDEGAISQMMLKEMMKEARKESGLGGPE